MGPSTLLLSDTLPRNREISIFGGLTRSVPTVSSLLESSGQNSTILAPSDQAITSLPRKPWEDAADYDKLGANAYAGQDGTDRANENMRRWLEGHVVPRSPWSVGEKVKTQAGNEVWWEEKDGKRVIMPKGIEVTGKPETVGNGELWTIAGVLSSGS